MDDYIYNRKHAVMRGSRTSLLENRRPLRTTQLTRDGLDEQFSQLENRSGHCVEFETKYLGDIPGVSVETDTTNRTEVLKIIDRGKKQGLIPLHLSYEHDSVLNLSKHMVKVFKRDGQEVEQLSLPVHEIAQVCYVQEEGLNILAVKHGTVERFMLAVLHCAYKDTAEAICSLVSQIFHLVYTDAMIDLIEDTIDKAIPPYPEPDMTSTTSDSTPPPGFISGSVTKINVDESGISPMVHPAQSDISTESSADLLREYMWQLNDKLKPEELKTFSSLLKSWNYSSNKLQEFCDNLFKLYGPERKYLLTGLFPFIPERDCQAFENFLKRHDIRMYGQGTLSSFHDYPPPIYTRSISDTSIQSNIAMSNDLDRTVNGEDLDTELEAMGKKMEKIELSVGETAHSYLPSSYDKKS